MRLGEGGRVCDHGGPVSFMTAFHPGEQEWDKLIAISNEHLLAIFDPLTNLQVDIGVTSYVDDLHAKHVINSTNRKAHEPICKLQK